MNSMSDYTPDILVVDDDKTIILLLHDVLSLKASYRFALTAKAAYEALAIAVPDLILLDIDLPDKSGLELCAELKKNPNYSDIPVLFITSNSGTEFESEVFSAGAVDFIPKPLNPQVVSARVNVHLNYRLVLKRLDLLSRTDALSGLANRMAFDDGLSAELSRAKRQGVPLSLVLMDIDQFKLFNDGFGHLAGDACIKGIAGCLQAMIKRPSDLAARYGGEEFALILPGTDAAGAETLIAELQVALDALKIKHVNDAYYPQVTMSFGFTTFCPEQSGVICSARRLIDYADRALYQSKEAGRNCVTFMALDDV